METFLFNYISKYISLAEEEKKAILTFEIFKSYKKGTILLKRGQVSDDYNLIIQGCIRSYYVIDGEEKTTAFYTESKGFYPNCCVTGKSSKHYISCMEDSIIIVANPWLEEVMYKKFPRFLKLFLMLSKKSNARIQYDFDEYKTSSAEQRYLNLLKSRSELFQRIPQCQMASYLGIPPQSLSRIRKRFVK